MKMRKALTGLVGILAVSLFNTGCAAPSSIQNNNNSQLTGPGPLDAYYQRIFASPWGSLSEAETQEEAQAIWDEGSRREQEDIARCMAEQGFNYIPIPVSATVQLVPETLVVPPDSREFAEAYGFGVSQEPQPRFSVIMSNLPGIGGGIGLGPNQAAVDAMSEPERRAWDTALRGAWVLGEIPLAEVDWTDPSLLGCRGQAWAMNGHNLDPFGGEVGALREEIHRLRAQLALDPRVLDANAAWFSCMVAHGYAEHVSPAEMRAAVADEWAQMMGWYPHENPQGFTWEQQMAFKEREVTLALASWDCAEQANLPTIERQVDLELQQHFVDTHRGELERWAQIMEERRAEQAAGAE